MLIPFTEVPEIFGRKNVIYRADMCRILVYANRKIKEMKEGRTR